MITRRSRRAAQDTLSHLTATGTALSSAGSSHRFPDALHEPRERIEDPLDLGRRRAPPEREPDRRPHLRRGKPEGEEDVTRSRRPRGAGRAGRGGDAGEVERLKKRLTFGAAED